MNNDSTTPKPSLYHKLMGRKEFRYLLSGVSSEVIEYVSFFVLIYATNLLILSNSISFILGIASGFVFHKLFSFRGDQQFKTGHQIASYSLLATGNFFATNILISVFVHQVHILPAIAKLMVMAITAAWSFLIFNKLIFKHKSTTPNRPA